MEPLRVLIVEDEPLVSMIIGGIVEETVPSVVIVKTSVEDAKKVLADTLNFALLDVDVTNGKTYEIARLLTERNVPYVFVSGSERAHLPPELQNIRFIPKPFQPAQIRDVVLEADRTR
jgi:CheY-like chemotaxis protein